MEAIYTDSQIKIDYYPELQTLAGEWKNCHHSEQYISGIKNFKEAFIKTSPKHTLWNHEQFHVLLDDDLQQWTNTFYTNPVAQKGFNGKVGIHIGNQLLSAISVDDLYEKSKYDMKLRFFKNRDNALTWIKKPFANADINTLPKVDFKEDENGKIQISLSIEPDEFHEYFALFKQVLKNRKFSINHAEYFYTLTDREREVLKLTIKGYSNIAMAEMLFISIETVKTHRKNILSKLRCRNACELTLFKVFF